jgi:hypothetical protein
MPDVELDMSKIKGPSSASSRHVEFRCPNYLLPGKRVPRSETEEDMHTVSSIRFSDVRRKLFRQSLRRILSAVSGLKFSTKR